MKTKKAINFEDPISVSEFAKKLGVSSRRVRQYIQDGRLQANRYHPRGKFQISPEAVDSWVARKWIENNKASEAPRLFVNRGIQTKERVQHKRREAN